MDRKKITELVEQRYQEQNSQVTITRTDDGNLLINGHRYDLLVNESDAFDLEMLKHRYVSALSKYNYIVGDIGYGQLRLRGFYNNQRNVDPLKKVSSVSAYLSEFCNFGSPYFILHNLEARNVGFDHRKNPRKKRNNFNRYRKHNDEPKGRFKGHKSFKIITKTD